LEKKKSSLKLVGTGSKTPMPSNLGQAGRDLWQTITRDYRIADSGSRILLEQAARALDQVEEFAAQIAEDGPMVATGSGSARDHPLIRHVLAGRAFVTKTLQKIGVVEARSMVGRPPRGGLGVGPDFRPRRMSVYDQIEQERDGAEADD
jgi:hypothetical protein